MDKDNGKSDFDAILADIKAWSKAFWNQSVWYKVAFIVCVWYIIIGLAIIKPFWNRADTKGRVIIILVTCAILVILGAIGAVSDKPTAPISKPQDQQTQSQVEPEPEPIDYLEPAPAPKPLDYLELINDVYDCLKFSDISPDNTSYVCDRNNNHQFSAFTLWVVVPSPDSTCIYTKGETSLTLDLGLANVAPEHRSWCILSPDDSQQIEHIKQIAHKLQAQDSRAELQITQYPEGINVNY